MIQLWHMYVLEYSVFRLIARQQNIVISINLICFTFHILSSLSLTSAIVRPLTTSSLIPAFSEWSTTTTPSVSTTLSRATNPGRGRPSVAADLPSPVMHMDESTQALQSRGRLVGHMLFHTGKVHRSNFKDFNNVHFVLSVVFLLLCQVFDNIFACLVKIIDKLYCYHLPQKSKICMIWGKSKTWIDINFQ